METTRAYFEMEQSTKIAVQCMGVTRVTDLLHEATSDVCPNCKHTMQVINLQNELHDETLQEFEGDIDEDDAQAIEIAVQENANDLELVGDLQKQISWLTFKKKIVSMGGCDCLRDNLAL